MRRRRRAQPVSEPADGDVDARLRALEQQLRQTTREAAVATEELRRLAPQLAALEARLENLRQQLTLPSTATEPADVTEARDLVTAIRREHEQVRVRFTALGQYEERLRRLEDRGTG